MNAPRIWFEVGYLIDHFTHDLRFNGIQRVGLEVLRAARENYGERVALCRMAVYPSGTRLEPVDYTELEEICAGAAYVPKGWPRLMAWLRRTAHQLASFVTLQTPTDTAHMVRNDIMIFFGTDWSEAGVRAWLSTARSRLGIRFATMIHDVIPFSHPEMASPVFVGNFTNNFRQMIDLCDLMIVSSNFSTARIEALCRERSWPVPPIARIHFGAGFASAESGAVAPLKGLPPTFVMFVSSIEGIRKNHILLVRVWRLLIERHGAASVPSLVFLGTGRLVDSVAAELRSNAMLRDKIVAISNPSDEQLRDAYRRCLFTVYPSLVEGWGLPVAEAMTFGKFCIASDRTSLPEVGGDLIDYFNPEDEIDAAAKIERALLQPGYLASRMGRIAREFHPASWRDCAVELRDRLDAIPIKS